jgi:hypothetical protein
MYKIINNEIIIGFHHLFPIIFVCDFEKIYNLKSFSIEMNRRASDSGAHLLLFQQQYGVTGSNTFGAVRPTHVQSPSSNV